MLYSINVIQLSKNFKSEKVALEEKSNDITCEVQLFPVDLLLKPHYTSLLSIRN